MRVGLTAFRQQIFSTVKLRYLDKLASRHMNAQDGFPAMYFTSISRHPYLSPSPQPTLVLPHVIWPRYVATFGRSAAAETDNV